MCKRVPAACGYGAPAAVQGRRWSGPERPSAPLLVLLMLGVWDRSGDRPEGDPRRPTYRCADQPQQLDRGRLVT
ncbi:hypothetical protein ACIQJ4_20800 [Streptomyces filamentosus]|uniref:hypothetical protein n=1 Tax=Streptomyces filamentosus TaxID=67294 RepID=UPI0038030568